MKNILKRKKLNNKGFTLIELLAVIVILAVVMGVAATSVLSAMNNSRRNTLQSSAKAAADGFRTAYAEAIMQNESTILGISNAADGAQHTLNTTTFSALNISEKNYSSTTSFVIFNKSTSRFDVCLVAPNTSNYYIAGDVATNKETGLKVGDNAIKLSGMWACSNDTHSWND